MQYTHEYVYLHLYITASASTSHRPQLHIRNQVHIIKCYVTFQERKLALANINLLICGLPCRLFTTLAPFLHHANPHSRS